ncbi:MAG: transcriptional regulator [Bacillota bacterium]
MKTIYDEMPFFKQLLDMLEQQLGRKTEIVLHDLTADYNHTIVDIRNGHITNRKVGDCGSNIGLQVLSGKVKNGDKYGYITHTKNSLILKSSTLFIKDDEGKVIGSLCINQDITKTVEFEQYLSEHNQYFLNKPQGEKNQNNGKEIFVNNVNELMDHLLQDALNDVGKPVNTMDKEDKMKFLKYLDDRGAFIITKAGEKACDFLGISKYTLYNYLDIIRNEREKEK